MPESVSQITDIPKGRDTPPHLADDSIFDQPKLKIPVELVPISGPIYNGDAPKTLRKGFYSRSPPIQYWIGRQADQCVHPVNIWYVSG